jgi:hypothetical protein
MRELYLVMCSLVYVAERTWATWNCSRSGFHSTSCTKKTTDWWTSCCMTWRQTPSYTSVSKVKHWKLLRTIEVCGNSGFLRRGYENSCPMGCYALYFDTQYQRFTGAYCVNHQGDRSWSQFISYGYLQCIQNVSLNINTSRDYNFNWYFLRFVRFV